MWPQLIPRSFKESQDDLLKPGAQQRVLCSSLPVRKRLRQRRDRTVDVDTRVKHVISGRCLPLRCNAGYDTVLTEVFASCTPSPAG